jgi:hypothetical protein
MDLRMEQTMVRVLRAAPAILLALGLASGAAAQQPGTTPSEPLKFAWLNSSRNSTPRSPSTSAPA